MALGKHTNVQSFRLAEIIRGEISKSATWGITHTNPQGGGGWDTPGKRKALDASPFIDEAARKAARKFHVPPVTVALAALDQWGRSLSSERDRRMAESDIDPRRRQALRGHISRELLAELREHQNIVEKSSRQKKG